MTRRELIRNISILTGAAFLGADLFLVGCKSDRANNFNTEAISFLDEVAETIIPKQILQVQKKPKLESLLHFMQQIVTVMLTEKQYLKELLN